MRIFPVGPNTGFVIGADFADMPLTLLEVNESSSTSSELVLSPAVDSSLLLSPTEITSKSRCSRFG